MRSKRIIQFYILILFSFLITSKALSEDVYDYLKKDLRFVSDMMYLNAHNNHGSKRINLDRLEIWFSSCSNKSGTADRIYNINRFVSPYSDFEKLITSNFPYDGEICYLLYANFIEKSSRKIIPQKKESWFKWWYLLIIPLSVWIYDSGIFNQNNSKSNKNKKVPETKISETKKGEDFLTDLIEGRKSLAESYWLYFVLINGAISLACGYFFDKYDSYFYFIPTLMSNLATSVGVWNSATFFQLKKIKQKKPYGWATAAKVSVVLNALFIVMQGIILLNL